MATTPKPAAHFQTAKDIAGCQILSYIKWAESNTAPMDPRQALGQKVLDMKKQLLEAFPGCDTEIASGPASGATATNSGSPAPGK